jgi:hypothetical protein
MARVRGAGDAAGATLGHPRKGRGLGDGLVGLAVRGTAGVGEGDPEPPGVVEDKPPQADVTRKVTPSHTVNCPNCPTSPRLPQNRTRQPRRPTAGRTFGWEFQGRHRSPGGNPGRPPRGAGREDAGCYKNSHGLTPPTLSRVYRPGRPSPWPTPARLPFSQVNGGRRARLVSARVTSCRGGWPESGQKFLGGPGGPSRMRVARVWHPPVSVSLAPPAPDNDGHGYRRHPLMPPLTEKLPAPVRHGQRREDESHLRCPRICFGRSRRC